MHSTPIQRHTRGDIWIPFGYHSGNCSPIIVAKWMQVVQGISQASSTILSVQGPGLEPSTDYESALFSRCRILFDGNGDGFQYARSISMLKMLRLYGIIAQHGEINPALLFDMDSTLYSLIPHSLPYEFWIRIIDTYTSRSHILYDFISSYNIQMSTSQCFHIEKHIACNTTNQKKWLWRQQWYFWNSFPSLETQSRRLTPRSFKICKQKISYFLKRGQLQMLNNCLILYKPVMMNSKYLALIFVPQILRKRLFDKLTIRTNGRVYGWTWDIISYDI